MYSKWEHGAGGYPVAASGLPYHKRKTHYRERQKCLEDEGPVTIYLVKDAGFEAQNKPNHLLDFCLVSSIYPKTQFID